MGKLTLLLHAYNFLLHVLRASASCLGSHAKEFKCTRRPKGQACMELLAAYSMANHPADIILTDSFAYHILRLRSKHLIIWASLPPAKALAHIADVLCEVPRFCLPFSLFLSAF